VNHELKTGRREWSILIPAWSIVVIILTYIVYWSLALTGTPGFSDLSAVTGRKVLSTIVQTSNIVLASDSFTQFPPSGQHPNPYLTSTHPLAIPQLYDLPIGMVNRVLYHHKVDTGDITTLQSAYDETISYSTYQIMLVDIRIMALR